MNFKELGLTKPIVRAVAEQGYSAPTPIQSKAIPLVLEGRDVLGCAQTGTGKTGAFALPILHRLATTNRDASAGKGKRGRRPRALVLCPTRELASQILDSFKTYGHHLPLRAAAIFGGVGQAGQVRQLRAGVDVLVATPGRLMDLMEQGLVELHRIEILVLDEADRMLDMGFIGDIRKITADIPSRRQTLLFSATMPDAIRQLSDSLLVMPEMVQTAPVAAPAESVAQSVYMVPRSNKPALLERLLGDHAMERTLVFTRTKHGADRLVKSLRRSGIDACSIHGDKSQKARTTALARFKTGHTPVLVATDIASRGIDVNEVTHVVNYDMPHDSETYVHRIGRTARAGASGIAFSFCDHAELRQLRSVERLIDMKLEVADGEKDLLFEPAPRQKKPSGPKSRRPGQKGKNPVKPSGKKTRRKRRSAPRRDHPMAV